MRTIPDELVTRYEAHGWWTLDSLGDLVVRGLDANPDLRFAVHSDVRPWTGTIREVHGVARKLAGGLRARGVRQGDVVAFQLPNWMEAAAVFWASTILGAVVVPIVHIYGRKEVGFILDTMQPKVFITAEEFGSLRYDPDVYADVPIVGVVGRDFDDLLESEEILGNADVDPASPAVIAFTSGTTSNPKGVVHSHRSLGFEARQLAAMMPADQAATIIAAPVGHFIGMLSALLVPLLNAKQICMVDVWNTERVLSLIAEEELSVGGGVPFYFVSLIDHPDFTDRHRDLIRYATMGGSAVPVAVAERLERIGISTARSYGSTEHPSISGSMREVPDHKRIHTDGNALPGVEIKIAEDGEIISRGPDLCIGYIDPDLNAKAFDDEGWYHTGDIGHLDEDGFLTISDRKSDIIIRGGENISALEVEEALLTLPCVAEAVVVAVPDERFGEHAAAILRLKPQHDLPTMAEMRAHFAEVGLAKQKWPEELHELAEFPRTPSGKVQKFVLRRHLGAAGSSR
ncbi:AMP-binding protein [Gordonia rhizosphera]|uniref:Putative fatty-acid--CoA ligase n=1 Tax=Gordonia rhizosphera NBRC 16068 TaxID=1108045 RepID=K6VRJ6_9ACTN|nr:AMP-binding protein [Gordonia rhizosphera]GAB89545.1 putative fatty-acid--CoA ligase [Gordonia rhizosphera NBRC 16068]